MPLFRSLHRLRDAAVLLTVPWWWSPAVVAAPPVAVDDTYALAGDTATSIPAGAGVAANDQPNGHPVETVLVAPPTSGDLVLNADGSFRYTPAANASGSVTFSYKLRTVVPPVLFTIDQAQSRLQIEARATTDYGTGTDRDDSRVTGTLRARLNPSEAPFATARITELDARLVDQLDLNLRFGCFLSVCLATVNVKTRTAEPDGLTLAMTVPGPEAAIADGVFSQRQNTFALAGVADLTGSGLATDLVPTGPQALDTTAVIDLDNTRITAAADTLTLRAPVLYTGRFYLDPAVTTTNFIDLTARSQFTGSSGFLVATAPASANVPQESPPATVTLVLASAPDDADADGMADDWERANGLDPGNPADAAADGDGDGADNRSEFLAGTDPRLAASVLAAAGIEAGPERLDLTFSGLVAGTSYQLEASGSLTAWQAVGDPFAATATRQTRSVPVPAAATHYRLRCLTVWP
jgi:hypothetical protein